MFWHISAFCINSVETWLLRLRSRFSISKWKHFISIFIKKKEERWKQENLEPRSKRSKIWMLMLLINNSTSQRLYIERPKKATSFSSPASFISAEIYSSRFALDIDFRSVPPTFMAYLCFFKAPVGLNMWTLMPKKFRMRACWDTGWHQVSSLKAAAREYYVDTRRW